MISNRVEGPGGIVATRAEGSLHIGPLPAPEVLQRYKDLSRDTFNAIVDAFKEQGENRRSNERWVFKGGVIRSILGVIFAFIIGMTAILGGIYLVVQGHDVAGSIFGGFGLANLINAFLLGTKAAKDRREGSESSE